MFILNLPEQSFRCLYMDAECVPLMYRVKRHSCTSSPLCDFLLRSKSKVLHGMCSVEFLRSALPSNGGKVSNDETMGASYLHSIREEDGSMETCVHSARSDMVPVAC
jgi:hypothetical protein